MNFFFVRALHLFVLWGFAIAQPLYDIFSQYADFFVAHKAVPLDLVLLVSSLSIGFPLFLVMLLCLTGIISKKLANALYYCMLGLLAILLALLLLNSVIIFSSTLVIALAILFAAAFLCAYYRLQGFRSIMSWVGVSIVIFPIQFLILSPVQQIVFPEQTIRHASPTVDSETPVIFVIFEALPLVSLMEETSMIDPVRYPNFHSLAETSHWFRNYTVNALETKLSVPAILTGRLATHSKLMLSQNYPESLFTLLQPQYRIIAEGLSSRLAPKQSKFSNDSLHQRPMIKRVAYMLLDMSMVYLHMTVPAGLASNLPPVSDNWNNFYIPKTLLVPSISADSQEGNTKGKPERDFKEYYIKGVALSYFLESLSNSSEPTLYYLHSTFAHDPWTHSTSGRFYGSYRHPGVLRGRENAKASSGFGARFQARWGEDAWLVALGHQRHLLEISYVDKILGELIQRLETLDIFDESLIIVTSDHGSSFKMGARVRTSKDTVAGDILAVPMFIKLPFQKEGTISDVNMEAIDVLPTVADILDIDLQWDVDGRSIFDNSDVIDSRNNKTLVYINEDGELNKRLLSITNENRGVRLQHKLSIFGSGRTRPNGYFRIGQYGDLVGTAVSQLPVMKGYADMVAVQFNEQSLFDDVDPENRRFVPVLISGTIVDEIPEREPVYLAIAINGVVEATTRTFRWPPSGPIEFEAMLPERALKKGRNEVKFFTISTNEDSEIRLSPVRKLAQ